jgi:hypothetical protein
MRITCPHCEKTINAPDKLAGRVVKCPGCKEEMELPTLEELGLAAAPPAPPQAPAPQQRAPAPQQQAPAPPPPPPEPEPLPEADDELAGGEAADGEGIDERAATRRDSRRKSQRRGSRKGSGRGGDGEGALKSYRRNMVILGVLLLPFALVTGGLGLLMLIAAGGAAVGAGAATQAETGAEVASEGLAVMAGFFGIIGAVLGGIGLFELIMSICAFLKKNWVNWVIAILMSLQIVGGVGTALKAGKPVGMAGLVIPLIFLLLAVFNIKNYGKLRAAGLDASGKPAGSARGKRRSGGRKSEGGDGAESKPAGKSGIGRRRTTGSRSRSRRRR